MTNTQTEMLYAYSLGLIRGSSAVWIEMNYVDFVKQLLSMTNKNGKLDILIMMTPDSVLSVQRMVRSLYEIAEEQARLIDRSDVDVTVLVDGLEVELRKQKWEVVATTVWESDLCKLFRDMYPKEDEIDGLPEVIVGCAQLKDGKTVHANGGSLDETVSARASPTLSVLEEEERQEQEEVSHMKDGKRLLESHGYEHSTVAVGGTFDHLHAGHKLLLTVSGYLAKQTLIVGITGPKLLVNKKYADAMQSFEFRESKVREFLEKVFPSLDVETVMINDVYGPTAQNKDIEALVLSKETRSGGDSINKMRKEKHWNELIIYEVDLVGSHHPGEKLSSTDLRKKELEEKKGESSAKLGAH